MILDARLLHIDPPPGDHDGNLHWLARHDADPEMHATVRRLLEPPGDNRPRTIEAVLMLSAYIALTAPIRATLPEWGDEWEEAVRKMYAFRSIRSVHIVQRLLRATAKKEAH